MYAQVVTVAPAEFTKFDDAYFVKTKAKAAKGSDGFFAAEGAKVALFHPPHSPFLPLQPHLPPPDTHIEA